MKALTMLAAGAALILGGISPAVAAETVSIKIEILDFNQVPFEGQVSFSGHEYRFSDQSATPLQGHADMSIRRVSVPVDREAMLAAAGSDHPISICVQSSATGYDECLPTSSASVRRGTYFIFNPEGW